MSCCLECDRHGCHGEGKFHTSKKILADNFALYVLYYCWQQGDRTKHFLSLRDVCHVIRCDDEYGEKQIDCWRLAFAPPSICLLRTYKLDAVIFWYHVTYEIPQELNRRMIARATTHELKWIQLAGVPIGSLIIDITTNIQYLVISDHALKPMC